LSFWWRDDDAVTTSPALHRLLGLAQSYALPLAVAVVPKRATEELAKRLLNEPKVAVFQHGWSHRNYAPPGERKMELGDHRPLDEIVRDLSAGFDRLSKLFAGKFCPVLVPPWNRISAAVQDASKGIGLLGLSTFGPADSPHRVNTHIDIFRWKPDRHPHSRAEVYSVLHTELERRLRGEDEPIGILTHHLVHEEVSWDLLQELFELTARHPAIEWPDIRGLFARSFRGRRGSGL
jgi:hypothetical protein